MHQGHLQSRPWPPWHQREAPAVCVPSHGHLGLPHPDTGPDSSPTTCIKHRRHLGSPVQPRHPLRPQHLCQEEPWCCSEMLPLLCCMQDPRLGAAAGCVELAALPFYSNPQTVCVPAPHDHPVAAGLLQKAAGKPTGNRLLSVAHALGRVWVPVPWVLRGEAQALQPSVQRGSCRSRHWLVLVLSGIELLFITVAGVGLWF